MRRAGPDRLPAVPRRLPAILLAAGLVGLAGCAGGAPTATPPLRPGTAASPREINVIARDYVFAPDGIDLVPGETILLHVINGGLEVHEAVIGDAAVQDAWEIAEAASAGHPPGPTPVVSVPPDVAGLRVVVRSGERVDVEWTVPAAAATGGRWVVGCHTPGHWARGMQVPVRWTASVTPAAPGVTPATTPAPPASRGSRWYALRASPRTETGEPRGGPE
jgi:hypothetical protein